jgi:hypothetical protein
MLHYIEDFKNKLIIALKKDLENIKSGKTELADNYTELLEQDLRAGIEFRKEKKGNNMRSIGAKNIKLIKSLVREELSKFSITDSIDYRVVRENVMARVPNAIFDTWEMAFTQVENVLNEEIMNSNR